MVKDIEREYQRRLRGINKEFNRICHGVKEQLLEVSMVSCAYQNRENEKCIQCVQNVEKRLEKLIR